MNDPKTVASPQRAQPFSLKTPLVSAGSITSPVILGENLWLHMKIYAEGGENATHCHPSEEHSFVVLDGEATFYDRDENTTQVGPFRGMLIPKGVHYRFLSSGDRPLVMIRIGAGKNPWLHENGDDRLDIHGKPLHGSDPANGTGAQPGVPIPGAFFGE